MLELKIAGVGVLILVLFIGSYYLYATRFGKKKIGGPRKPKISVPVTYTLGWWQQHLEVLTIKDFNVNIVTSKLNLFNDESLLSYTVAGEIKYEGQWQPKIKKVHISERLNKDTTQNFDRIIEITPVIASKRNKSLNGGIEKFEFTNEIKLTSTNWGPNRIQFICMDKEQVITLSQTK